MFICAFASAKISPLTGGKQIKSACTSTCKRGFDRVYKWSKYKHGIRSAAVFMILGLVLEVFATAWAFNQAIAAGALDGDVQCDVEGILAFSRRSEIVETICAEMTDTSLVETAAELGSTGDFTVGCGNVTSPSVQGAFDNQCGCSDDYDSNVLEISTSFCAWVGVNYTSRHSSYCFAHPFTYNSTGWVTDLLPEYDPFFGDNCWAKNPSGTPTITIVAFSVALFSQIIEAFVARQYFKDPTRAPHLMTAASILEAVGVIVVTIVLMTLPSYHGHQIVLHWIGISAAISAGFGGLAEMLAGYLQLNPKGTCVCGSWCEIKVRVRTLERDRSRDHVVHYCGAIGNAAIWLGAAVLEVVVATFLVWKGEGIVTSTDPVDWGVFRSILATQIALEVLALITMWAAKYLWIRTKLRMLVEIDDYPRPGRLNSRIVRAAAHGSSIDPS